MKYHQNDLLREFFELLDRQNLWVLGSLQFYNCEWLNICIDVSSVRGLQFNLDHAVFHPTLPEDDEDEGE